MAKILRYYFRAISHTTNTGGSATACNVKAPLRAQVMCGAPEFTEIDGASRGREQGSVA